MRALSYAPTHRHTQRKEVRIEKNFSDRILHEDVLIEGQNRNVRLTEHNTEEHEQLRVEYCMRQDSPKTRTSSAILLFEIIGF